jgi:hypothetical protein
MRLDLALDMQGVPGRRYAVIDDFYGDLAYTLTHLAYSDGLPLRSHPLAALLALPRNPVPEPIGGMTPRIVAVFTESLV